MSGMGIKRISGNKYENLYTVDLLCRGVPSPKMHMKKIQSYEEKAKSRVREFRDKSKYEGWANFGEYMTFKNGKKDLLVDGMIILMIVYSQES